MQCKRVKSKEYSESKVSGKLHQNRGLEDRSCGKTCKRGTVWSCDVKDT